MKNYVQLQFDDGTPLLVENYDDSIPTQRTRSAPEEIAITKAEQSFSCAISNLRDAANTTLNILRELDQPNDIVLEFGVKFSAKAGAILASVDSGATFKITLKWSERISDEH